MRLLIPPDPNAAVVGVELTLDEAQDIREILGSLGGETYGNTGYAFYLLLRSVRVSLRSRYFKVCNGRNGGVPRVQIVELSPPPPVTVHAGNLTPDPAAIERMARQYYHTVTSLLGEPPAP